MVQNQAFAAFDFYDKASDILSASISESVESAINWVLHSGIQNEESAEIVKGGFNCYFSQRSRSYPYVYTEATGYGLSFLTHLMRHSTEQGLLMKKANSACTWLLNNLRDNGLFNHSCTFPDGPVVADQYTFDAAICGLGLLSYEKIVKEDFVSEKVHQIADGLVELQRPEGSLPAVIPNPANVDRWSNRFNVHHAKMAMFLAEAADFFGDSSYVESALKICELISHDQTEKGLFMQNDGRFYIHSQCYACEGLLYVGKKLDEDNFEESSLKGISRLASLQNADGSMNQWHPSNGSVATDVLAQSLRLWQLADKEKYAANISKGIRALMCQQYRAGSKHVKGGFRYSSELEDVNSWATFFSVAALTGCLKGASTIDELF